MVAGIRAWMLRQTASTRTRRQRQWRPDLSSASAYRSWLAPRRRRLARLLGVGVDARLPARLEVISDAGASQTEVARGSGYRVFAVRWPVLEGVDGEGLLLQPEGPSRAQVVALPDCDQTPEQAVGLDAGVAPAQQFARRLAENGCTVVVPALVDRDCELSGIPGVRFTNMPHREFVYRAAYELGRHVLGYELERIFALVDAFSTIGSGRLGVVGYGEGGLLSLYAAALDERLEVAGVSGAFGPREGLWEEPIYRNLFGLLRDFGDAELAAMVAPRRLVVEASRPPAVSGPPAPQPGRSGAAPGALKEPTSAQIDAEAERASRAVSGLRGAAGTIDLIHPPRRQPGSEAMLLAVLRALGARRRLAASASRPRYARGLPPDRRPDPRARRDRLVGQLVEHTQVALAAAEHRRAEHWSTAMSHVGRGHKAKAEFARAAETHRRHLARNVIGELPAPRGATRARSRQVYDTPAFRGYEVVLDVYGRDGDEAHVFSYGILLVPKGVRRGQRRPVVVCQHGLEGRPQDVADPAVNHEAYHAYACRLAERGFVTFAPQNPYIGGDEYRAIQRMANPLGWSLFSVIVRQHERILEWLGALPFVDRKRIAFYGLSYGGKAAMRVPAILTGYCLSICSADYNEWIWKCASTRHRWSYMGTGEYDMPEFDLGNTYNYAEMSWLIFPRPFMVERGHHDGVAPDEWVAYEYARTRRTYVLMGLGERTEIEFFDGPHTINGMGTFRFLDRHLRAR
jgi:dienelactone hydrolase